MNDLLAALRRESRILQDRYSNIHFSLQKDAKANVKSLHTETQLKEVSDRLTEVNIAIDAIVRHRKANPIEAISFTRIITPKELITSFSHAEDRDKPLYAYIQQHGTFEHIVGIRKGDCDGKPTIDLIINVIPKR